MSEIAKSMFSLQSELDEWLEPAKRNCNISCIKKERTMSNRAIVGFPGKTTMLCRWVFVGTSLLYFQFADAQDVMKVAANHYKVLVENAHVRVVENTLNPGDKDSTHTHPAGWYYVTKPGTMKIDFADGNLGRESGRSRMDGGGRASHI
jgi:hypothetical protein